MTHPDDASLRFDFKSQLVIVGNLYGPEKADFGASGRVPSSV
jgi:hypothetical protein